MLVHTITLHVFIKTVKNPGKREKLCALKKIPNAFEHTSQRARDKLERLLKQAEENYYL